MSSALVILGAGASADFGVPTLKSIFKDSYAKEYLLKEVWLHSELKKIFWTPRGVDLNTSDTSLTVEEMLTIIRDWEQEEILKKPNPKTVKKFRAKIYKLIMHAIFVGKSSSVKYLNQLIKELNWKFDEITWASFNWDCIFESSYWYIFKKNPKLIVKENWRNYISRHTLLKLHGGINWWNVGGKLKYHSFGARTANNVMEVWKTYDENSDFSPVILEPSYYKYESDCYNLLEGQWDYFFRKLIDADCVVIVGYSLPEGDAKARSTILLGFQANKKCNWLIVDPNENIISRYETLLGRKNVTYLPKSLAGFNSQIKNNLASAFPNIEW